MRKILGIILTCGIFLIFTPEAKALSVPLTWYQNQGVQGVTWTMDVVGEGAPGHHLKTHKIGFSSGTVHHEIQSWEVEDINALTGPELFVIGWPYALVGDTLWFDENSSFHIGNAVWPEGELLHDESSSPAHYVWEDFNVQGAYLIGTFTGPELPVVSPEPATLVLMGMGLTGMALRRRKS